MKYWTELVILRLCNTLYFYDFAVSSATQIDQREKVVVTNKMGSLINIMRVGIILAHISPIINDHFTAAQKTSPVNELNCDETPPNCDGLISYNDGNINKNFTYDGSYISMFVTVLVNSSSSRPVCAVDPFQSKHFLHKIPPKAVFHMNVACSQPGTRIVVRPELQYIIQTALYYLFVTNCTVYWKDISTLGRLAFFYGMRLLDWEDEFTTGESEYFDACVHFEEANGDNLGIGRSIAGCRNVGEIEMKSTIARILSPVFVRHLWPAMTELAIER